MDRYSFGTYLVDEFNQEAFTLCHDIANLSAECEQPVMLVGDTGTGKTHLLYSIIGRIRTSSARAGIAYVTASDFPAEVRNLVTNPAPVEEAPHAVLLVDQLESFKNDLGVLEKVVRLFLENGHSVVCATNVHPARLQTLPAGLSQLLVHGHQISILPQDSPTRIELLGNTIREEHEQVITRLEEDVAELRNFLTSTSESHSAEDVEDESLLLSLRKELELTRTELSLTKARVNVSAGDGPRIKSPSFSAQYAESISTLQQEIEQLRAENALNAVATKEARGLRIKIENLENERNALRDQLEQHGVARLENADEPLPDAMARDEARVLVERAEALIEVMHRNRDEFNESNALHSRQMSEIRELESIFKQHESLTGAVTDVRSEQDEARIQELEVAVKNVESERDDLADRLLKRQETLDKLHKDLVSLRKDYEEAQRHLILKTDQIMALDATLENKEKEFAESISGLNQQISDYEDRMSDLLASARAHQQNEQLVQSELVKIQAQLGETRSQVDRLLNATEDEDKGNLDAFVPGVDVSLLDTLEGAKLLGSLDLQEAMQPEEDDRTEDLDIGPSATLHHVETLRNNIEILTHHRPANDEGDSEASNA